MRIAKAFSLIEIIVVIVLIGIIFSLVLSSYVSKKKDTKLLGIEDIPSYVAKYSLEDDATLYMYGKKCSKGIILLKDKSHIELPSFGFSKDYEVYKRDKNNEIEKVDFEDVRIVKKKKHICFKLDFKEGRFTQKLIVSSKSNYYMFAPFFQEVERFNSFEDAKKRYKSEELKIDNIDEYYRE